MLGRGACAPLLNMLPGAGTLLAAGVAAAATAGLPLGVFAHELATVHSSPHDPRGKDVVVHTDLDCPGWESTPPQDRTSDEGQICTLVRSLSAGRRPISLQLCSCTRNSGAVAGPGEPLTRELVALGAASLRVRTALDLDRASLRWNKVPPAELLNVRGSALAGALFATGSLWGGRPMAPRDPHGTCVDELTDLHGATLDMHERANAVLLPVRRAWPRAQMARVLLNQGHQGEGEPRDQGLDRVWLATSAARSRSMEPGPMTLLGTAPVVAVSAVPDGVPPLVVVELTALEHAATAVSLDMPAAASPRAAVSAQQWDVTFAMLAADHRMPLEVALDAAGAALAA